jgi:hypothetical protein
VDLRIGTPEWIVSMPSIADLAVYMSLTLVLALYGLTVSGHFPLEFRATSLKTRAGRTLLWSTIVLSTALAVLTAVFAWQRLPVAAAVIGGGAMVLFAPLVLRPLPDSFVNGRSGLITFAALGLALGLVAGHAIG